VSNAGEYIKHYVETWEAHKLSYGMRVFRDQAIKCKITRNGIWVAESTIVAMIRVTTGESRVGR
jgi:hypothetical protein